MNYDASIPIYLQVVTAIRKDIASGVLRAGDKLPSGRDLAIRYRINPNTSVRVYQVLEQEGICHTKRGLGTFVNEDPGLVDRIRQEMADELLAYFMQNMRELGFTTEEITDMIREEENNDAGKQSNQ
ncbi:GntR family transcriptional regulator [Lachnoclostridium sp. Marseille-P6806]|uniref:GntR family transcriptional regulator n=1 Tax=Lachnoclostridium sp. Marseille-P6806 TaxID=2364793 RepID=UPI0010304AAA|nr:GntR family transcriptional regulator [Lachnoclostridium sp. Marseille-P6806]